MAIVDVRIDEVPMPCDTPEWMRGSFWAHPDRVLNANARAATSGSATVSTPSIVLWPESLATWLPAESPPYPPCENLKARIHLRDDGIRPHVELEPTEHPLAIEQRNGISVARVAEIVADHEHRGV